MAYKTVEEFLNAFGDALDKEASGRVDKTMALLAKCSPEGRRNLLASIGINSDMSNSIEEDYVRNYLDTMDLLDELETVNAKIEEHLRLEGVGSVIICAVKETIQ
jgi:CO dehydrogenase/acetyl-CoA synthase delta subunit